MPIPSATILLGVAQGPHPHAGSPFLEKEDQTRIFNSAQNNDWALRSAPSAWVARHTTCTNAEPVTFGMDPIQHTAPGARRGTSRTQMEPASVTTGRDQAVVQTHHVPTWESTSARVAESQVMGPKHVLEQRTRVPLTPYKAKAWRSRLSAAGLTAKYPNIPEGLARGFDMGFPKIVQTFSPPNGLSKGGALYEHLAQNISHEMEVGRYVGPFSRDKLEGLIGCFQSSLLSIIPKPGKLGKYRIIQNFSFPYNLLDNNIKSINSQVNLDGFPCTWGTFDMICQVVRNLPPGSQAAVRDVAEAY